MWLLDSGLPNELALTRLDWLSTTLFLPFVLYRVANPEKRHPGEQAALPLLRQWAYYGSFVVTILLFARHSFVVALTQCLILQLHRSQLKRRVSLTVVQLWWSARSSIEISRLVSYPLWINWALVVSTLLTCILEYESCPWSPEKYEDATVWGRMNVSFLNKMMATAQTSILTSDEFAGIPQELNAHDASKEFLDQLDKLPHDENHRVMWAILATYKWKFLFIFAVQISRNMFVYTRPTVLALFLQGLADLKNGDTQWYGPTYYGIGLALIVMIGASFNSLSSVMASILFAKTRRSLQSCVYRKTLLLDSGSREKYDSAKIMNLLDVDATMVEAAFSDISTLIAAPMSILLCVFQLYYFLGTPMLASVPIFAMYAPFTSWASKKMMKRFPQSMAAKDRRAKSTMAILRSIKSLKLYAWEEPYVKQVLEHREGEVSVMRKFLWISTLLYTISTQLGNVVNTAVLLAYLYLSGAPLTPQIVFPTLSMLALVTDPLFSFPRVVTSFGRAFTAETRLSEFLQQPEEISQNYTRSMDTEKLGNVILKSAVIKWASTKDAATALDDISLDLSSGDLCCIVGKVGSGKSAFCKAICGQLFIDSGSIDIGGRVAYCSQEPWLQFKSLKENILFGIDYDEEYYASVVEACDLNKDIALFEKGDETEIGEKGVSLSGGQRARVALARAVYSRSSIIILDDVLSAVDEHVSSKLISTLFSPEGLLADRTVILATNTAGVLKYSSHLVCLSDKHAIYNGKATESSIPFLTSFNVDSPKDILPDSKFNRQAEIAVAKLSTPAANFSKVLYSPDVPSHDEMFPDVPLWRVFTRFFRATGLGIAIFAISAMILATLMDNLVTIWLTIWSNKNLVGLRASESYAIVYLTLSVLTGVVTFVSVYTFNGPLLLKAAIVLHEEMLRKLVRLPLTFFDRTPLGAIMNRFTGDIRSLDVELAALMQGFLRSTFSAVISLTIAIFGVPFLALLLIPLFFRYNYYRKEYIPSSRQISKFNSSSRGPILSHIEESIKGVSTVNAFGVADRFIVGLEKKSNYWMTTAFLRSSLRRWLNYRIRLMTAIMTLGSTLSLVALVGYGIGGGATVGIAGIVLHSVQITAMRLSYIISSWTNLEVSVVAIERILDYTDRVPEAPARIQGHDVPELWPQRGEIRLQNYSTRYRPELPPVLNDITLSINSREKIGIVGRTGAGKSSLTLALFRIIEASSGSIVIDDKTISEIGLYDLRSRLSIIPQDAQILKGTLRMNLDPLGLADDARLHQVLDLCRLQAHFPQEVGGLDFEISDGGENVSRGQAQLICLGRALLRPGTVLVLDEATASVDAETDSLVQATIRKEFSDRTIVTIAHRLNTVMDSDKILVLDKGSIAEFDSPAKLLEAKGAFYSLVQAHKKDDIID